MNDALETIIVKADNIVDDFILDWQKTPELWLQEIDIQVELTNRIMQAIPKDLLLVEGRHLLFKRRFKSDASRQFSRVTCEPYVRYGAASHMHPDVVIWNDPEPDQSLRIDSGKSPILYALEIKYDEQNHQLDFARLKSIQESKILTAGCALRLHLAFNSQPRALKTEVEGRVRCVDVWLKKS